MRIPYQQINTFTREPFGGNPAGVCFLERWIPDRLMQAIAAENDLAETAFLVANGSDYDLRWFTPTIEMDLCGHATLAPAFLLFSELGYRGDTIRFHTKSGALGASRRGDLTELDFPAWKADRCDAPRPLEQGLGRKPREVLKNRDYVAVFDDEADVASIAPNLAALAELDCLGIIATAPGKDSDYVLRFFAPRAGVDEDPVTGSAQSSLIPYWALRLGKIELVSRQLSKRRGEIHGRALGERVGIGGRCVAYSRGEIEVPDAREWR